MTAASPRATGLLLGAWLTALAATLSALFVGEIMGQTPCTLCWYQRVFMFPLAVLLGIACYDADTKAYRYALPLAGLGWLIAAYHCLLYYGLVSAAIVPCSSSGPSCTSADMTILGRVPLPLLSLAAFTVIATLLALMRGRS